MRKHTDSEVLHGDHIGARRCCSSCRGVAAENTVERGISIWDNDPTSKGAADEEKPKSEVNRFECALEVLARVYQLPSQYLTCRQVL
jgi:hypothetical protein